MITTTAQSAPPAITSGTSYGYVIVGFNKPAEVPTKTFPPDPVDSYERNVAYALRDASFRGFAVDDNI